MIKPRLPRDLLDPIVAYFKPQRVILFGSRARGEATRDSDLDLLVVVDDDTPAEKLKWQDGFGAYRSKCDADIFPVRSEDFERDRAIVNTLAAEADADGIVVYGSPKGSCMRAPDTRARWEVVNRWLEIADVDRNAAQALLAVPSLRSRPLPLSAGAGKAAQGLSDPGRQTRRQDACARPTGSRGRQEFP